MKLTQFISTSAMLSELAQRLAQYRVDLGLTQQEVADKTGISLRTLNRIEAGEHCQFSTIILLLQVYSLVERLDMLVPERTISPIQFMAQQKQQNQRKRASKKHTVKQWTWGDEQ